MAALLIADIEVTDVEAYAEYQRQVPAYVAADDGRFVVRGGRAQTLEGSWPAHRLGGHRIPFDGQAAGVLRLGRVRDVEVAPDACIRLPDHRRRRSGRPASGWSRIVVSGSGVAEHAIGVRSGCFFAHP